MAHRYEVVVLEPVRKSVPSQRVWSEEEERVILKGLKSYSTEKKLDPMKDLTDFLYFIKKDLREDCNRSQLLQKILQLKEKYEKDGIFFTNSHEKEAYELSKTVWGPNAVGESSKRGRLSWSGKGRKRGTGNAVVGENESELDEMISRSWDEFFVGDKEWKKFRVEELEQYRNDLMEKIAKTDFLLKVRKSAEMFPTSP